MNKKLIAMTLILSVTGISSILFAANKLPKDRPLPDTRSSDRGARSRRPDRDIFKTRANQAETMIKQQSVRMQSEIDRINKSFATEKVQLQAILVQAKKEKASKTVKMLTELIEQKSKANAEKASKFANNIENFKKQLQKRTSPKGRPMIRPSRESSPEREKGSTLLERKPKR
jgi:hypothetical protein